MKTLLKPWVVVVLAVAVGSVGLYFAEWIEVTANEGYSATALRNPYLAAEQFLAKLDVKVHDRDGLKLLDELPSDEHSVLIASSRRSLSQRRVDGLLDWVKDGGRLLLLATDFWDHEAGTSGDKLLDSLGIQLYEDSDAPAEVEEMLPQIILDRIPGQTRCGSDRSLTRISFADEEQTVRAALSGRRFLSYDGDYEASYAGNDTGPQLYFVNVGDGAIVVMTSLAIWRNSSIGCHDHAHVLRWLVEDRPVLWWLFNTEMAPLPVLVWQRWPALLIVCGVLLFTWVWRSGFRPVRPLPSPPAARRELLEQLDGVARFYWQHDDAEAMLKVMRRDVIGERPVTAEHLAVLARESNYTPAKVRWALETTNPSQSDFLEQVRVLQVLIKVARRLQGKQADDS